MTYQVTLVNVHTAEDLTVDICNQSSAADAQRVAETAYEGFRVTRITRNTESPLETAEAWMTEGALGDF